MSDRWLTAVQRKLAPKVSARVKKAADMTNLAFIVEPPPYPAALALSTSETIT